MSVPNQLKIQIEKSKCDKENLYCKINLQSLEKASKDLKGEAFKLWIYFSNNQDKYIFDLSKKACIEWGIGSESSYKRGKEELINKGYLQKIKDNFYKFIEQPK